MTFEVRMTFEPDRRSDLDDPIRRRMADSEGAGWVPVVLGVLLLVGFAYLVFDGLNSEPRTTRESNVRVERPVTPAPPAPVPTAPN